MVHVHHRFLPPCIHVIQQPQGYQDLLPDYNSILVLYRTTPTNTTTQGILRPIPTMYALYNATLHLLLDNSALQQPHEYNDWVGLLIQNRTTSRFAPKLMVYAFACVVVFVHGIFSLPSLVNFLLPPLSKTGGFASQ